MSQPRTIFSDIAFKLRYIVNGELIVGSDFASNWCSWREREWNGRVIRHKTFRSFIETPPIEGCGWPLEKVEKLIEHDVETLAMWRDAVTAPAHRPKRFPMVEPGNGPRRARSESSDNVTTYEDGRGNAKSYTVSRLRWEAPKLYEEVKERRLSANAAAIQAGFRKKATPFEIACRQIPKLTPEERYKLKELLISL